MERAILMCRETDLSLEVMIANPPSIGSRLKIKRCIDKKIMNIYRVKSIEYATYEYKVNRYKFVKQDEEKKEEQIDVVKDTKDTKDAKDIETEKIIVDVVKNEKDIETEKIRDAERQWKKEIPHMRCEIKLEPLYYNYHHKTEYVKRYNCVKCKYFFPKDANSQTGGCDNVKSEKGNKTVYENNICLQGFLEMKDVDRRKREKELEEKKIDKRDNEFEEVEIYDGK